MRFREFGNSVLPTIILLHGGGLSWWSLKNVMNALEEKYHIITPIIDGHGEDGNTTFSCIEDSAEKLIEYIDSFCGGKVHLLGGLSIGGQIVCEVLSRRKDIAEFAIIESGLVYPIKGLKLLAASSKWSYGLLKQRWFAKLQAKTLFVSEEMFDQYYRDSLVMSKETLNNITLSNGSYMIKPGLGECGTKTLIIVGGKELKMMKKSAELLHQTIKNSQLYITEGMGHGEISLTKTDEYVSLVLAFIKAD